MDRKVNVSEAAEMLHLSKRTVWNYLKKSILKGFKEDGKTFILVSELTPLMGKSDAERVQGVPEGYMLIERQAWEELQREREQAIRWAFEMGCRIGQLEAERMQLQESVKLLEDKRPWWRKWRR